MAKVKIKTKDPNNTKMKLHLGILSEKLLYVTRISDTPDGFVILTNNDEDKDSIFQDECLKELTNNSFTRVTPHEIRAIKNNADILFRQPYIQEIRGGY